MRRSGSKNAWSSFMERPFHSWSLTLTQVRLTMTSVYHSEHARLVSDDEMQRLWAKVLAGEVNKPGSFSKRTLEFPSTLEKDEAHLFTRLCSFVVSDLGLPTPVILNHDASIYVQLGINYNSLSHLESIGLIRFHRLTGWHRTFSGQDVLLDYFGDLRSFKILTPDQTNRYILRYGVSFHTNRRTAVQNRWRRIPSRLLGVHPKYLARTGGSAPRSLSKKLIDETGKNRGLRRLRIACFLHCWIPMR